ncbi:MAG: hypothetical protein HKN40_14365 [Winogradskyella sp.]|uniref:hypothetical protein n=1 Tax=Winogradskyella sp. TaxID=1883156 RepID=UPI0017B3E47F|nr:hypothetical protein [Winogradskyella sp.]
MTITKAIERITWRLRNGWKANQNDTDAINEIINFVNEKHNQQLQDNVLFAKLYIIVFAQMIKRYKTDVFDSIPQKELHRLLELPLKTYIERFTATLNENEYETLLKSKDLVIKHPKTFNDDEKKRLSEITLEEIKDTWDIETVGDNLTTQINHAINQYKDKHIKDVL